MGNLSVLSLHKRWRNDGLGVEEIQCAGVVRQSVETEACGDVSGGGLHFHRQRLRDEHISARLSLPERNALTLKANETGD